jgi:CrcB protein
VIQTLTAIALGSALGGVLRYLVGAAVHVWLVRTFPWGTLTVNVLGCTAIGIVWVALASRGEGGELARAFVIVGLLGGFTTFSSFGFETFALLRNGYTGMAVGYAFGSMALGLVAVWAGYAIAR